MLTLAKLSIRRPKVALAAWLALAAALSVIGFGVSKTLSPSITVVPGTESARAQQLAGAHFGPSQLVPILLEGPKAQLDREGPRLVAALLRRPHTRVLSAWDAGTASAGLRPSATAAMIVASIDRSEKNAVRYDQPEIERLVSHQIARPVKAFITGQPSLDRALKDASLSNLRRDELIATGIVLLLLLVGLRAPIAALLVTAVGAISVLSGFGEVALLGHVLQLDPVGVALGTMTGLALAVAFALLIVDRFHREAWPDSAPRRAAASAAAGELQTTGKAVLIGGSGLVLALAIVAMLGPTTLMVSLGTGMLVCATFAIGGAVVVMPAALVLLGRRIDALAFPAPALLQRAWSHLVDGGSWVTRRAVYLGFAATAVLAALAVPALGFRSGPLDVSQLPPHSEARIAFSEVSRVMGPGWPTPYNLIVVTRNRPITDPAILAGLSRLQTQVAHDSRDDSVTGPGQINSTSIQLSQFWPSIKKSAKLSDRSKQDLLKLINGLGQAGAGAAQLQSGLAQASSGASQAHGGSGQAQSGAQQLHAGLLKAKSGSAQVSGGLDEALVGARALRDNEIKALAAARALAAGAGQLSTGSQALKTGADQALAGARALSSGAGQALAGSSALVNGVGQAARPVKAGLPAVQQLADASAAASGRITGLKDSAGAAQSALANAITALGAMTTGKSDSRYADVIAALGHARDATGVVTSGLAGANQDAGTAAVLAGALNTQIRQLSLGLDQLRAGAAQLQGGIQQLHAGNVKLTSGIGQLATGSGQLATGIGKLANGNSQLATGIGQLASGIGQLATGVGKLAGGGSQLGSGLGRLTDGAAQLEAGLAELSAGTGQLASGLAGGVGPAGELVTGVGLMQASVAKARGQIPSTRDLRTLEQESPGLFSSGYFVLAAVEGAQPSDRNAASFTINLLRGGTAGQIVVVSKYKASDRRTEALGTRLGAIAQSFGKANHAEVAVGGPAGNLGDLTSVTNSRIWLDLAAVAVALVLVLVLALRTLILPIVAVAVSLLVAAATFGILDLLFVGPNPPLGGPGHMDPMSILGIVAVVVAITFTFATLLLTRTREGIVTGAPSRDAVRMGLRETAAPSTGAGLVMIASIVPFAATDLINVRQFGIGVAIAVLLDILVVRPVLLPAAASVLGRFGWWPTWPGSPAASTPSAGEAPRHARRLHLRPHRPRPADHLGAPR
jgi:X-X-X-Leu-X-X-Gly heptad repeat protein